MLLNPRTSSDAVPYLLSIPDDLMDANGIVGELLISNFH